MNHHSDCNLISLKPADVKTYWTGTMLVIGKLLPHPKAFQVSNRTRVKDIVSSPEPLSRFLGRPVHRRERIAELGREVECLNHFAEVEAAENRSARVVDWRSAA